MANTVTIAQAINLEGNPMSFDFSPTCSWQAFVITGLPEAKKPNEGKGMSLGKAVSTWNACIKSARDALQTTTVSSRLRQVADQARTAKAAETRARPLPNF